MKKLFFRNPHEPAHVYFSENVSMDFIRSTELILFLDYLDVKYLKLMPCIQNSLAWHNFKKILAVLGMLQNVLSETRDTEVWMR